MTIKDILEAASVYPSNFQQALAVVLPEECEFVKDANGKLTDVIRKERPDSHGWTFAGLNQKDDGLPVDSDGNVTASPEWIVATYYRGNATGSTGYWLPCCCNRLPFPLNVLMFCQAVNQGIGAEALILQRALNDYGAKLVVDGKIGQMTCQAAMACPDSRGLAMAFLAKSRSHYRDIVAEHPEDAGDLAGWLNRIDGLQAEFCNGAVPAAPSVSPAPTVPPVSPQQVATTATPPPSSGDGLEIEYNFNPPMA